MNSKWKFLFLIIILSASVFSAVTYDDCYKTALKYVKYSQGESLDMKPKALTHYGSDEYWVFEVKSVGNIQFMLPINAKTGFLFYESNAKDVMKAHYLANFFATEDSLSNFLSNLLDFAQHQRSDLNNKKTNLETYVDPYLNVTINSESDYKSALDSAISADDSLRSSIISLQGELISLNSFDDVSKVKTMFGNVFTEEANLLNDLNQVVDTSNKLHKEVGDLYTAGEIDQSTRDAIITYTTHNGLADEVVSKQDALKTNRKVINDFFNGMDDRINQFYAKLVDRVAGTTNSSIIEETKKTLKEYASTYNSFDKQISEKQIPASYENLNDKMIKFHNFLSNSNEQCSNNSMQDCQAVMANFSSIDSLVKQINASITSFSSSSCTEGQRMACVLGDKTGYKTCNAGQWGECVVKTSTASKYNIKLIAALVVIIIGLIAFKYKDDLMDKFGGNEEESDEDTGSWQSQFNQ